MIIYLDNAASTQVGPEVAKAVYMAMTGTYANPSALHTAGQEAERLIKQARQQLAFSLGTKAANIVFTSGGTESINLALFSAFFRQEHKRDGSFCVRDQTQKEPSLLCSLLCSVVEHPAVLSAADALAARGVCVEKIPVHGADTEWPGMVDTSALRAMLSKEVRLVSVMHVNNETGTINPIEEISRIIELFNTENDADVKLHVDAVQSYGKLAIDVDSGDFRRVDTLSMSAHKLHGPKGVGALYAARPEKLHPMVFGGGQEGGARSGTENVPGIAGFGLAARLAAKDIIGHAKEANTCRRRLLEGITAEIPDVRVNSPMDATVTGKPGNSSPYILNVSFRGTRGEVLVHELEKNGIFVSTGAACASIGKDGPKASDTLAAIGLSKEDAEGAIRFSFSWHNKPDETGFVVDRLKNAVANFRRVGTF